MSRIYSSSVLDLYCELKKELKEFLYLSYIKPEIIPEGLIQIIVLQWVCKIKV